MHIRCSCLFCFFSVSLYFYITRFTCHSKGIFSHSKDLLRRIHFVSFIFFPLLFLVIPRFRLRMCGFWHILHHLVRMFQPRPLCCLFFCWCFLFLKRWNNFLCNYLIFRMLLLVIILLYYSKCQLIEIQSYHFTSGFNPVTVCTGPAWHLIISSYHLGLYFSMFFSEKGHSAQVSVWLKGGINYINLSVTICAHIIYMKHEHDYSHKI